MLYMKHAIMESMSDELATYIISRRQEKGWGQRELGRRAGVSGATISNLEGATVEPTNNTIVRIALALNEDPQNLLRLAGHLPAAPPVTDLSTAVSSAFRALDARYQAAVSEIVFALAGTAPEHAPTVAVSRSGQPLAEPQVWELSTAWDDVCTEMEYCATLLLDDWTTERAVIMRHFRVLSSTLAKALMDSVGDSDRAEWSEYVHRLLEAHRRHSMKESSPPSPAGQGQPD